MAVFVGTVVNKVDRKGRVSVPASFRATVTGQDFSGVYVAPAVHLPSLEAYDANYMARLTAGMETMEDGSEAKQNLEVALFGTIRPLAFDKEGRIMLPRDLIEHAGIEDQAAFVGLGSRFQIWKPAAYDAHSARAREAVREQRLTVPLGPNRGPA